MFYRYAALLIGLVVCLCVRAGVIASPKGTAVEPAKVKVSTQTGPLRIGVVGLVHGHVEGLLWQASHRDDLKIVGVYEPNRALFDRLAAKYKLDPSLYHASLTEMLDAAKPEAVSVMTSIKDHKMAVEACAPRGVHMLLEKPLAFRNDDAKRFEELASKYGVLILTNFETSWYASVREAKRLVESGDRAPIRKMVFRHGHKGPREIGCSEEFLSWLTDPDQNGGGALVDFGCYGAVLSTWFMNGERPISVTASAASLKPNVYPRVDDDATIVVTYPGATTVIEASWAWTHDNKEADIYTERGSIHTGKWDDLHVRNENGPLQEVKPPAKPENLENEWTYLRKVVRGECEVDPLSSLKMNVVAVDILDQARQAVARAKTKARARSEGSGGDNGSRVPPLVLAFYYPWYGTPTGPGGAMRGNQFVHWEGVDAAAKTIASSTNYPVDGAYDSHDPVVLDRHCQMAKAAGIDGLIISWWGKGSFEDKATPSILDACSKAGVKACIYYEQVAKPGTPQSVAEEIVDIVHRYSVHPAYLKVTKDGAEHPVVFVYGRAVDQLGVTKWKAVQEILARGEGVRPLLIGDGFGAQAVGVFDGTHSYGPAGDVAAAVKRGESTESWARHAVPWWAGCGEGGAAARAAGKISCVTVFPGYDDRKIRKPGLAVDRDGGKFYELLWREAVAAKPDWVLVTTFNEWHEGSEIEPSVELGDKYMKMTGEWAAKFKEARALSETLNPGLTSSVIGLSVQDRWQRLQPLNYRAFGQAIRRRL